jgi:hypothetical protein
MYYQLHDSETEEILGTVKVNNSTECWKKEIEPLDEVTESWTEFNKLEEHDVNPYSVEEFVTWNNENRVTQIERIFLEFVQP